MPRRSKFADAVIERWGTPASQIAAELGCSVATVYNVAKAEGLPVKTPAKAHRWIEDEDAVLIQHFSLMRPAEMVALLPHLSYERIRKRAKVLGLLSYRSTGVAAVRHDFFGTVSRETAYWAGFLAADGSVSRKSDRHASVHLSLSDKDKEHVERFNRVVNSSRKVGVYKDNFDCMRAVTAVSSVRMADDLASLWSVVENKTEILVPPTCVTVDSDEALCFVAGYMDGDGGIYDHQMDHGPMGIRCKAMGTLALVEWSAEVLNVRLDRLGFKPMASVRRLDEDKYQIPMFEWCLNGRAADAVLGDMHALMGEWGLRRKWERWEGFSYDWVSRKAVAVDERGEYRL